ncbi:hypothetical protein T265_05917 [Opisthorchis viverrini]|uniref:Uncharacterized protein n=1 Tax=Opisthorchis viverrini TaxID=6198 RepID=A0A075AEP7_OPIVI|nr:hypothetical protein T265_05917 [Opisthorchis viverrini]KER26934.1 hypothetical protein T265_05917 [Opisthorchis viverrini]
MFSGLKPMLLMALLTGFCLVFNLPRECLCITKIFIGWMVTVFSSRLIVDGCASRTYVGKPLKLSEEALKSDRIVNLTRLAIRKFNEQNDELYWYAQREISSGRKWLHKGAIYELDLILHPTYCMKNTILQNPDDEEACAPKGNSVNVSCAFLVWQRVWDNHNVMIDTSECLRAEGFDSGTPVREIHTQPEKLIKSTKAYQEVIRDIGEQLKQKSQLPPDAPYTEYFYIVKNKMAILEYKWNLTGCLEAQNANSSECYDKLPENTLLTCSAEFDWPYGRNGSWVELLECALTPTVSREDELYSITHLAMAKEFNTSLPIEYPTFMGRTLSWHFRKTEESIAPSPEDENWIFPLISKAYMREHQDDNRYLDVSPQEFINMRKQRIFRHPYEYKPDSDSGRSIEENVWCNMTLFVKEWRVAIDNCQESELRSSTKAKPLSEEEKSEPWFARMLELLTEQFSDVNPLEAPFIAREVHRGIKRSVSENGMDTTLLELTVKFKLFTCLSESMYSTCDPDAENIICDVVVKNTMEHSDEWVVVSLSDCSHSVKLPTESIAQWNKFPTERLIIEPQWQSRLEHAVRVHNSYFSSTPNYTRYYATDAHVTSTLETEAVRAMFELNMDIEWPVNKLRSCRVVITESEGGISNVEIYNCKEEYLSGRSATSGTYRPMRKTEINSDAFVKLQKLAVSKANKILTTSDFYYKLSHIQRSEAKVDDMVSVEFEMVLIKTDCNRVDETNSFGQSECSFQDFGCAAPVSSAIQFSKKSLHLASYQAYSINHETTTSRDEQTVNISLKCQPTTNQFDAEMPRCTQTLSRSSAMVCHVQARSISWVHSFRDVRVSNCRVVDPTPPNLNLPSTYLDIMAAETTFSDILKEVEVDFNKMNSISKYFGLVTVDDVVNHMTQADAALFVTFEAIFQETNWEKKNVNILVKSEDYNGESQNFVSCNVSVRMAAHEETHEVRISGCIATRILDLQSRTETPIKREEADVDSVREEAIKILNKQSSTAVTFHVHLSEVLSRQSVIVCRVTYWIRTFPKEKKTLDIEDCRIFDHIKQDGYRRNMNQEEFRKFIVDPLSYRFLRLINGTINATDSLKIDDIYAREYIGGGLFESARGVSSVLNETFEFYANLVSQSVHETCANFSSNNHLQGSCHPSQNFYQCHCKVTNQPWLFWFKELEVVDCVRISKQPMKTVKEGPAIPLNLTLVRNSRYESELSSLRQHLLSTDKLIYGDLEIRRDEQSFAAGKRRTISIEFRPAHCNSSLSQAECNFWRHSHFVECTLVDIYADFDGKLSTHLIPKNCRKVLNQSDSTVKQLLHSQSWKMDKGNGLPSTETNESELSIGIVYSVARVENVSTQYEDGRLVTFNAILQVETCKTSLPLRNDTHCSDWLPQGQFVCKGQIFEGLQVNSKLETKLFDCYLDNPLTTTASLPTTSFTTLSATPYQRSEGTEETIY